jgi:uncharacterized membrane protein
MGFRQAVNTTVSGFAGFWIPVLIVIFLVEKMFNLLHHLVVPVETYLPVKHLFGVAIISLLVVVLMVILSFAAGVLLTRPWMKRILQNIETKLLELIPGYNSFKTSLQDQNTFRDNTSWHAALIDDEEDSYLLAYTTEESEHYYTVHVVKSTVLNDSELTIMPKSKVHILNISPQDFMQYVKRIKNTSELVEKFAESQKKNN